MKGNSELLGIDPLVKMFMSRGTRARLRSRITDHIAVASPGVYRCARGADDRSA